MNWHKVTFNADQISMGEHGKLANAFVEDSLKAAAPEDVALYVTHMSPDLSLTYYFSPNSVNYLPDLIMRYSAEPCEKPEPSTVKRAAGFTSADRLLGLE